MFLALTEKEITNLKELGWNKSLAAFNRNHKESKQKYKSTSILQRIE
jgi:hypothetical protein